MSTRVAPRGQLFHGLQQRRQQHGEGDVSAATHLPHACLVFQTLVQLPLHAAAPPCQPEHIRLAAMACEGACTGSSWWARSFGVHGLGGVAQSLCIELGLQGLHGSYALHSA